MKKWLLVLLAMVFLNGFSLPAMSQASDISLAVKGGMYFPTDSQFQQGSYLQLNLKWKNVYAFGSYTMTERRIAGQRAGAFNILGLGLGLDIPITKNFSIWGQGGYYIPKSELVGSTAGHEFNEWAHFQEVHYLNWQKWGTEHHYNVDLYKIYEYRVASGNIGGAIGFNLLQPLSKHIDIGIVTGYQFLKFKETFYARNPSCPSVSYIQTRQDANLSGLILGATLTYNF